MGNKGYKKRSNAFNFAAFLCFSCALVLIILLRMFQIEEVVEWYNKYTETLASYEAWIKQNGATLLSAVIILVNFAVKAYIPWVPISFLMVISGALFEWYIAILINVTGMVILFSMKFLYGRTYGGGNTEKILSHYDKAHTFIDKGKLGSRMVLFFARLTPGITTGAVSQLYGTADIGMGQFLLISLAGFSYKTFSYTLIGVNVFDPMSASFIIPLVFLFLFTGIGLLMLNGVISVTADTIRFAKKLKRKQTNKNI